MPSAQRDNRESLPDLRVTAAELRVEAREEARLEGARNRPSDWGSLVADLSNADEGPAWRVHDRTHLEFAVRYPVDTRRAAHEWEAYFFIPESLRLDSSTYEKSDIYADLQSYVRFAVPERTFGELAKEPLATLGDVVTRGDDAATMRELRLFACATRAAAVSVQRSIVDALDDEELRATALAATARMVTDARRITQGLRDVLVTIEPDREHVTTAARWVDEDVSRLVEMVFGELAEKLRKSQAPRKLRQSVVKAAVAEARYRRAAGLEGVGRAGASKRDVEHLEFRRHVLKRFTASVLWLSPEVREGARLVLQVLYAVAAGVAMALAVVLALLNGDPTRTDALWMWVAFAVLAYMLKDRLKAWLQGHFSKMVSKRFPDRRWRIRDRERGRVLGQVDEVSGFVDFEKVPKPVLERRRSTRRHPLEEQARPESVLWHRKVVRVDAREVARADRRFDAMTEIFRLDLRRWLAHTDDPKRRIVFADPDDGTVCSAVAPRVYNIGIVYRLRRADEADAAWHRIRVVVSRKGIRRIDVIG